jgi:N-methylhydantoinase A
MRTIYVPPHAGVLSALGLAITAERRERLVSVLAPTSALSQPALSREMTRAADGVVTEPGWARRWIARARYVGQGHELDVPIHEDEDGAALATRFAALHAQRNGFTLDTPVEVIGIRYVTSGPSHDVRLERTGESRWDAAQPVDDGGMLDVRLTGPAVVALPGATLRVASGWVGAPHRTGGWILERGTFA